jgi:hypothetical protein
VTVNIKPKHTIKGGGLDLIYDANGDGVRRGCGRKRALTHVRMSAHPFRRSGVTSNGATFGNAQFVHKHKRGQARFNCGEISGMNDLELSTFRNLLLIRCRFRWDTFTQ